MNLDEFIENCEQIEMAYSRSDFTHSNTASALIFLANEIKKLKESGNEDKKPSHYDGGPGEILG